MTYQELVASRYSCKKFAPEQISSEQHIYVLHLEQVLAG